jgi:hypothetical protein
VKGFPFTADVFAPQTKSYRKVGCKLNKKQMLRKNYFAEQKILLFIIGKGKIRFDAGHTFYLIRTNLPTPSAAYSLFNDCHVRPLRAC